MITIPEKEDIELRIKCLELAVAKKAYYTVEEAEEYYDFIVKNTSSSRILEAASEFLNKAKDFLPKKEKNHQQYVADRPRYF